MGKRVCKDIAMLKKHKLLKSTEHYQRAAAEQLNISCGFLQNLLREETALQTEA